MERQRSHTLGYLSAVWLCLVACGDEALPRTVVAAPERDSGTPVSPVEQPGEDAGPTGAEPDTTASTCSLDTQTLDLQKTCAVDSDCALFSYRPGCCPTQRVIGLSAEALTQAQACEDAKTDLCSKCAPNPDRAEDGRAVNDLSVVEVHCDVGRCISSVAKRQCGASHICSPEEICVIYENVPGGIPPDENSRDNAYQTFRCEPNPCPDTLDCKCARPLCDARDDAPRMCEVKFSGDSDVVCVARPD